MAKVRLFRLRDCVHAAARATLHAAMADTFAEIRVGRTASAIAARYSLAAFREAFAHDASAGRRGKILLNLSCREPPAPEFSGRSWLDISAGMGRAAAVLALQE